MLRMDSIVGTAQTRPGRRSFTRPLLADALRGISGFSRGLEPSFTRHDARTIELSKADGTRRTGRRKPEGREGTDMAELWKSLPSWVRNIVIPIIVVVLAWKLLWVVVSSLIGLLINGLVLVGIAAAVIILVKKASKH
ncbi:hypothetical protein P3T29_002100 [Kitasatospora sp. MAP5-34]|nr:hypothetical protein [Kitasatospora sp. MAP5-34]